MSDGRRIVLGEDDFKDDPVPTVSAPIQPQPPAPPPAPPVAPAATLPPVARGPALPAIPAPAAGPVPMFAPVSTSGAPSLANNPLLGPLGIALLGMFAAWGITELFGLSTIARHATSKSGLDAYEGLWVGVLAIVYVGILVSADRLFAGAVADATSRFVAGIIPAGIVGFIAGFAAQAVYTHMLESAFKAGDFSTSDARYYFARAVGWGIFGLGAGVAVGIVARSQRRAVNGAVGGLVGGALGGVIFEFLGLNMHAERFARLCGLLAIAALVALATRAVETARRDAWLKVASGGMVGKEFILYHAVTRIGSAPSCEIFLLKDPAVEPLHAQIEDRGNQRVLTSSPAAPAFVNNAPVTNHVLRNGDMLRLGNTVLAYSERAAALPM